MGSSMSMVLGDIAHWRGKGLSDFPGVGTTSG